MGFRAMLDSTYKNNLAMNKPVQVSAFRGKDKQYSGNNLTDNNPQTYWTTDDEITTGTIEIDLGNRKIKFHFIAGIHPVRATHQKFSVEIRTNQTWQPVAEGTTIGYKRILKLNGMEADAVRITIQDAKACLGYFRSISFKNW